MNTLSWMIYLTSFVERVNLFLVVGIFLAIIWLIGHAFYRDSLPYHDADYKEKITESKETSRMLSKAIIVLTLAWTIVPSKDTLYAITASEVAQAAVNSEFGQQVIEGVKVWVRNQLPK